MDTCSICFEPIDDVELSMESTRMDLACGEHQQPPNEVFHSFHRECMKTWQDHSQEDTCPTCRRPVREEEFLTLRELIILKWQRDNIRFAEVDARAYDGLDDIMIQIAKVLNSDDKGRNTLSFYGAIAMNIMLESGPPDATFAHSVEMSFRRLFDPDHTFNLAFQFNRNDLMNHMLITARTEIASLVATPPAFQTAAV